MPRRSAPRRRNNTRKTIAEVEAELLADVLENQRARGNAVLAPLAFEDEEDLPRQSLPMAVVGSWFR